MTYFEYGYNLDAQQKKDNEQYENNRKVIRVINAENAPPPMSINSLKAKT